jgi:hypothetical protein
LGNGEGTKNKTLMDRTKQFEFFAQSFFIFQRSQGVEALSEGEENKMVISRA